MGIGATGTAQTVWHGDARGTTTGSLGRVVVVGASLAGLRACETLRTKGFDGPVTLVGAEAHLPYDRPPLSKKLLAGDWEPDRVRLRKPEALDELGLDLRLGVPATGLDTDARAVALADGDDVCRSTGWSSPPASTPARPARAAAPGVHELRTLDDALALRARLAGGTARVVVDRRRVHRPRGRRDGARARLRGDGARGPAGAARARPRRRAGRRRDPRPRRRTASTCAAMCVVADVRRPTASRSATATVVAADVVVVGIGVAPVDRLARGQRAGAARRRRLRRHAAHRACPGVFAAGDVARWPHAHFDEELRIEHWTNAAEQGAAAAANLLAEAAGGERQPYAAVPFFWSDQGRHRIQMLGRPATEPGDDHRGRRGRGSTSPRSSCCSDGPAGCGARWASTPPDSLMAYQRLLGRAA